MPTNEETADVAGTTTTAVNNDQAVRTSDSSSPKRRRPLVFHNQAPDTDENTIHTLCGESFPRRYARLASGTGEPVQKVYCPKCQTLAELDGQLNREQDRLSKIAAAVEFLRRQIEGEL